MAAVLCNAFPLECAQGQVCHPVGIAAELFVLRIRLRPKRERAANLKLQQSRYQPQPFCLARWWRLPVARGQCEEPALLAHLPDVGPGCKKRAPLMAMLSP